MDIGGIRAPAAGRLAADIGPVRHQRGKRDQLALIEDRHVDSRVADMRAGVVGDIGQDDIALAVSLSAQGAEAALHRRSQAAHKSGQSGALRQHLPAMVRYSQPEILHFRISTDYVPS